jgi:hypothetical protein
MSITQPQIDELLATLRSTIELIAPLRHHAGEISRELSQVKREYDQRMRDVNAQADQLEVRRDALRARLAHRLAPEAAPGPSAPEPVPPEAVPDLLEPGFPLPPPLPEDPRAARKRALADHIEYFMDGSQGTDMQVINAVLVDERCDVGDMLEILAWGTIWTSRAEWERLEDQHERLAGWRQALDERLAFWQHEIRRLENDSGYALLRQHQRLAADEWLAYLDDLARQQEIENARLAGEVAVLQQALRARGDADFDEEAV